MSDFKSKAKEVYETGVAQRGEFTPTGVPLRVYKYWAKNAKRPPARENFCHFWRVVAIWAPLMFIRKTVSAVLESVIFWAVVSIAALVALVTACILSTNVLLTVGEVIGVVIAMGLSVFGIFCGASVACDEGERIRGDLPPIEVAKWGMLAFWTAVPVFLAVKFAKIKWVKAHAVELILGVVVAGLVALLTVLSFTETAWVGIIAGIVVVSAFPVVWLGSKGVSFVADWLAGKREIRKMKEQAYYKGEISFEEAFGYKPAKERERGKIDDVLDAIGDFFRGLGDFVILIAQVVRVNKWKICPTVEVK